MSGYRDRSGFDPNAGGDLGPPLRPFNKWQWLGVAMLVAGALVIFATLGEPVRLASRDQGRLDSDGQQPHHLRLHHPSTGRRSNVPLSAETRRRRLLIVLVAAALCALAAALIFYFKGA